MHSAIVEQPPRRIAQTAGLSLILMILASFFSYGYVHGKLVADGDAVATVQHLLSSHSLFQAEIFGWLVILVCDILVAWAFYLLLAPISRGLALLSAWLRLIYAAMLGVAIMNLVTASILTGGADAQLLFKPEQLKAQVMLSLASFQTMWSIGLLVFGGHLLVLSWLAFKSDAIPRLLGYLLLLAGIGYIAVHLGHAFLPGYDNAVNLLQYVFSLPMFAGELGFGLWLMLKRGQVSRKA